MYFKKYFIVTRENENDKKIEIKFSLVKKLFSENIIFLKPKIDTAPKIGIDNRKDILAESTLLKFKNLAAVMAIPDLLTPGISDKI